MKWRVATNLIVILVLLQMIVGCMWRPATTEAHISQTSSQQEAVRTKYAANVQIDPDKHAVTGTLSARFPVKDQQKAYFHLYSNAFVERPELSTPNWLYILGENRIEGKMTIHDVRVKEKPVPFKVNQTILEVPFDKPVAQGEAVTVSMNFTLQVPKNDGRLSYDDHAIWLGNWLPILAVNESAGWRLDPYLPIGDPFYSEVADYDVQIRVPHQYQIATTGLESLAVVTETRPKGFKFYDIQALNVRDFAVVAMDDSYRSITAKVGETLVNTWYRVDDQMDAVMRVHDVAKKSLQYYSKSFGVYPYQEYDVVRTGGFFGGMEYPSIVFIQDKYFETPGGYGDAVVAHETAHQWFYGVVGNDEIKEAWVDESLTDYATMVFLQQYDKKSANEYIKRRVTRGNMAASLYAEQKISAWQSVDQFPNWPSYSDLVYSRGGAMLWNLRQTWGEERVNEALRYYYTTHQYKNATGKDVVDAFTKVAGESANPYFDYWLRLKPEMEKPAFNWSIRGKSKVPTMNTK
ncbi:M1 family metallopeptidase [Brevibacillus sp. SYSU BS000544]|uniref:M1 family metallopeptidase n=1 Tax=Brevibacillus sp. SYSU BS000544 TaxID=3416443 RepID=UPI003CE499FE